MRPWRPAEEAARRAADSDLDAHRPVLPVRAPSQGVFGDVGPSEAPTLERWTATVSVLADEPEPRVQELRPPIHPALAPARRLPPRPFHVTLPRREIPDLRAPKAVLGPGRTEEPSLRPPPGPWGGLEIHREPPPMEGLPGEEPPESPPAQAEGGEEAPSPALDPVQAMKEQIRSQVGQAQGRVPKPEMPGAPGGQRGGKGKNIAAFADIGAPILAQLEAAKDLLREAQAAASPTVGVVLGGPGVPEGPSRAERQADVAAARALVDGLTAALTGVLAPAGSDAEKRFKEEIERRVTAALQQQEREKKKANNVPNYDQWKKGKAAQVDARDARDRATSINARAGQLKGKSDPTTLAALKETTKEAKQAAKDAKKAAKKAKDAARFGTEAEAKAAAEAAEQAADHAKQLAADADTILDRAEAEARGEIPPGDGGDPKAPDSTGGTVSDSGPAEGTGGESSESAPGCGDPLVVCAAIDIDCAANEKKKCILVTSQDPGGPAEAPGVKGRGMPEPPPDGDAATPAATATPGDGRYGASVSPEGTGEELGEAGAAPEEAPAEESPPESAPTGTPEATDEELKAAAYKTLTELAKLAEDLDDKIAVAEHNLAVLSAKLARKKKLTGGESKAYQKNLAELEIYTAARIGVEAMALRVSKNLSDGLSSRGKARESAFVSIRAAEWKGPQAVKEFLKDAERELRKEFQPVRDPDQLLRDLRQDIEWEIDRRLPPESQGNEELRDLVRNRVMEERERGDAPGFGSLLVSAFSEAAASFAGGVGAAAGAVGTALDTVTGRPVRFGILALRDAIHDPPVTGGTLWERAALGAFSDEIIGGYTGGLSPQYEDSLAVDLLKGVVVTAEVGSGLVGGAVWAGGIKAVGAGARAIGGRIGSGVTVHGRRGGFASLGGSPTGTFSKWKSRLLTREVIKVAESEKFIARARALGFTDEQIAALPGRIRQYGRKVGETAFEGWSDAEQFLVGRHGLLSTRTQRISHELGHVLDDIADPGLFLRSKSPEFGWADFYNAEKVAYTAQYGTNPVPLTAFNATAQAYPRATKVVVYGGFAVAVTAGGYVIVKNLNE